MSSANLERAKLSADEMRKAVQRFQKLIDRLERFDPQVVSSRDDQSITALETAISTAIQKTFPTTSSQHREYSLASQIDRASYNVYGTPLDEVREGLELGKSTAITLLQSAIDDLIEDLGDAESSPAITYPRSAIGPYEPPHQSPATTVTTDIFLVHGHDDGSLQEMARFIQKAGLNPIILNEQIGRGATLIEKLENYSDVGFAVVMMTPDDVGRAMDEEDLKPRARQNVIAELFYFMGKLGRANVFTLRKGDVEIPSDIDGREYTELDTHGAWKTTLLKELEAAGYTVDWRKALS